MENKICFQVAVKSHEITDDGSIVIVGKASTTDLDRYNDIVSVSAFEKTLPTFRANPVMLLQHKDDQVIGNFSRVEMGSDALHVVGEVKYDIDNCKQKIIDGVLRCFSIGYIPKKFEIRSGEGMLMATEAGYEMGYDWEKVWTDEKAVRTITELDLIEISVVQVPANPHALFTMEKSVKSFFNEQKKEWKALIAEKNLQNPQDLGAEISENISENISASDEANEKNLQNSENIPPSGDELVDTDNVANEVLEGLHSDESTEIPEIPADEKDGTVDEIRTEEKEEKDTENLETIEQKQAKEIEEYKNIVSDFAEIVQKQKKEIEELKSVLAGIPMRKGLLYTPQKKSEGNDAKALLSEILSDGIKLL